MKRNLQLAKLGISIFLLCGTPQIFAKNFLSSWVFKPYLGIEYQYEHIKAANDYHLLLPANYQSANLFLGTRINKYIGLEIGAYRSLKNNQMQSAVPGFNNQESSTSAETTAIGANNQFNGFSFDFDLYYELDPKFFIYADLGVVTMHPDLTVFASNNSDLGLALPLITGRNAVVPRLGFGLEYLEKHWGMRTRLFWVYTQYMDVNANAARALYPSISNYAWLQAVQSTVGIFYRF
jgi:hypothetical protein